MYDEENIVGTCMQMCPSSERDKRERNGIIHVLETEPHEPPRSKNRKGNPSRTIKSYSRSAAGQVFNKPELLRPPVILSETVNHLLTNVINDTRVSHLARYDFISDRLRSVKQDGVIQRIQDWCLILPPIIRFYAFSAYWYCEEAPENFDQKLNRDQLKDCLLLFLSSRENYVNKKKYAKLYAEVEALYLIVDNNIETINRAVILDLKNNVFQKTLQLILKWYEKKYIAVLRMLTKLPLLLACSFSALHLSRVRKEVFQVMSYAYNSKNVFYPLDLLQKNLLFNTNREVLEEGSFYGMAISESNESIQFRKLQLRPEIAPSKKLHILDEELSKSTKSSLLLQEVQITNRG